MLQTLWQNKLAIQYALLGAAILLAIWRGAAPERWSAGTFVGMFAFDRLYHLVAGPGLILFQANLGHVVIDGTASVVFMVVALKANRIYPLWLAGIQLMATVSHVTRAMSPAIAHLAYTILAIAPSYLQTVVFGSGVVLHIRRVIRHGPYRSWRSSSPPSPALAQTALRKRS